MRWLSSFDLKVYIMPTFLRKVIEITNVIIVCILSLPAEIRYFNDKSKRLCVLAAILDFCL